MHICDKCRRSLISKLRVLLFFTIVIYAIHLNSIRYFTYHMFFELTKYVELF